MRRADDLRQAAKDKERALAVIVFEDVGLVRERQLVFTVEFNHLAMCGRLARSPVRQKLTHSALELARCPPHLD